MKKYCVVISEITRKEIEIIAPSEEEALKTAKQELQSGKESISDKDNKEIIFHIKY